MIRTVEDLVNELEKLPPHMRIRVVFGGEMNFLRRGVFRVEENGKQLEIHDLDSFFRMHCTIPLEDYEPEGKVFT